MKATLTVNGQTVECDCNGDCKAAAINPDNLKAILAFIMQMLPIIISLFGKKDPPAPPAA